MKSVVTKSIVYIPKKTEKVKTKYISVFINYFKSGWIEVNVILLI